EPRLAGAQHDDRGTCRFPRLPRRGPQPARDRLPRPASPPGARRAMERGAHRESDRAAAAGAGGERVIAVAPAVAVRRLVPEDLERVVEIDARHRGDAVPDYWRGVREA